jgi:hypothetical protein
MSPIFSWLKALVTRGERQIFAEGELRTLELNHKYFRNKRLSDVAAIICAVLFVLAATAMVVEYVQNPAFHVFIVQKVQENFSAVIVALLTVGGIRFSMPKNVD